MIVAARSKTIEGPWENSPYNPIMRTQSKDERWWSKGHGTLVEDRAGKWWMVYHAYENGFYTLGRQALLEPIEWTRRRLVQDGRQRSGRADRQAGGLTSGPHGIAFSDDFSTLEDGRAVELLRGRRSRQALRYRYENGALVLRAKGTALRTVRRSGSSTAITPTRWKSRSRRMPNASGGLLVFYSRKLYAGLGFSSRNLRMHLYGMDRTSAKPAGLGQRVWLQPAQRPAHRARSTTAPTARRGSATTAASKCRATTTTSPTTSSACARRSTPPVKAKSASAISNTAPAVSCRSEAPTFSVNGSIFANAVIGSMRAARRAGR